MEGRPGSGGSAGETRPRSAVVVRRGDRSSRVSLGCSRPTKFVYVLVPQRGGVQHAPPPAAIPGCSINALTSGWMHAHRVALLLLLLLLCLRYALFKRRDQRDAHDGERRGRVDRSRIDAMGSGGALLVLVGRSIVALLLFQCFLLR